MWPFKKSVKKDPVIEKYTISFRVYFPLRDGTYRQTGNIYITVLGVSEQNAKDRLHKYAMSVLKIKINEIKKN